MENKLLIWRRTIYTLAAIPVVFLVILQLVNLLIYPIYRIGWPEAHIVILPCFEIVLILFLYEQYARHKKAEEPLEWIYILFFLAANLIILFGLGDYYYQFIDVNKAIKWVSLILVPTVKMILILGIVFSCIKSRKIIGAFYSDFGFNEDVNLKESNITAILIPIIVGALLVRSINLANFPPYTDEYFHIVQAIKILGGESIGYTRALLTVTLPVLISFKTLGISLLAGRIPMVLLNVLAIYPLFFLGKKVNLPIGIICSALFAFNPFIVATSRNIRDYAVIPLFLYFASIYLLELLDSVGNVQTKKYFKLNWFRIVIVSLVLIYALIDDLSVVKLVLSVYGTIGILIILKRINISGIKSLGLPVFFASIFTAVLLIWKSGLLKRFLKNDVIIYQFAESYWKLLIDSKIHHWYSISVVGFCLLIVSTALVIFLIKRRYLLNNFAYIFFFLEFVSVLFYLTYFHVTPILSEKNRYGVLLEYWYLPVTAVAIWLIYKFLTTFISGEYRFLILGTLIILFSNPSALNTIFAYEGGGVMVITGNRHYIIAPAYDVVSRQMTDKDVLITDVMRHYDYIMGHKLQYDGLFIYEMAEILDIVESYPRGWIALSVITIPENHGLLFSDFEYQGRKIYYLGREGDVNLWRWED